MEPLLFSQMHVAPKPEAPVESSWLADALGELGAFSFGLLKNFFRLFLLGAGLSFILACIAYYAASNGQVIRGSVAAGVTLIGATVLACLVAGKVSLVLSLSERIRANAVGQVIVNALFSHLLGVTTQNPEGSHEMTRELHGLPVSQLQSRLSQAGKSMLEKGLAAAVLPKLARWFIGRAQRMLVWATIRIVVAYATANKSGEKNVDLLALRASITAAVDELLARRIAQGAFRFALVTGLLVTAACWILVEALLRFPLAQP